MKRRRARFFDRHAIPIVAAALVVLIAINVFLVLAPKVAPPLAGIPIAHLRKAVVMATPRPLQRPDYERGMVFPVSSATGIGDDGWRTGLSQIARGSGAQWLELPVPMTQTTPSSIQMSTAHTPSPDAYARAIQDAHAAGYKVFLVPEHLVGTPGDWSGQIAFPSTSAQQSWFDELYNVYSPYVVAASSAGVDQVAVGTELMAMQQDAPASMWTEYIGRLHRVYSGKLTYDENWYSALIETPPAFFASPYLWAIGVSEYIPLVDTQSTLAKSQMKTLWQTRVQGPLDRLSSRVGKPLLLCELGYRNSWDLGWMPWDTTTHLPHDGAQQAAAFSAALLLSLADPHIVGSFVFGWQGAGAFDLHADTSALNAIKAVYKKEGRR